MAHSVEEKAAVIAALLAGQSVGDIAKEYSIPKQTVSYWKQNIDQENWTKKEQIGNLLVGYLVTNLETLQKQAAFFSNERWLTKQDASSVAVLHGVMMDKVIRLLEAFSKANVSGD